MPGGIHERGDCAAGLDPVLAIDTCREVGTMYLVLDRLIASGWRQVLRHRASG